MLAKLLVLLLASAVTTEDCFYRSIIGYERYQQTHFRVYPDVVTVSSAKDTSLLRKIDKTPGVREISGNYAFDRRMSWISRMYHITDSALRMRVIRELAPLGPGLFVKAWGDKYVGQVNRILTPMITIESRGTPHLRNRLDAAYSEVVDTVFSSGHGNVTHYTVWFKPEAMERLPAIYDELKTDSNVIEVHLGLTGIGPAMLR